MQGLKDITERKKVALVAHRGDEDVVPYFLDAFSQAMRVGGGDPDDYDVVFALEIPTGPSIVGLAVAPPTRVTIEHIVASPGLQVVAAASAGTDHIDVASIATAGIPVAHSPGFCDIEVAEHALAMSISLLRNLHIGDKGVRDGGWSARSLSPRCVSGSTLGILGLGRTGTLVAQRAIALGMTVLAWAPHTDRDKALSMGVTPVARLTDLLVASDVVTLHVPLTPETKHLIDADALAHMRADAYLVNCARGELVDLNALRDALTSGHLAGAALDVLDQEPPPGDHIALTLPNTILTPHVAWLSPYSEFASYETAAQAVAAVLCGAAPLHEIRFRNTRSGERLDDL